MQEETKRPELQHNLEQLKIQSEKCIKLALFEKSFDGRRWRIEEPPNQEAEREQKRQKRDRDDHLKIATPHFSNIGIRFDYYFNI